MVSTTQSTQTLLWSKAILTPGEEFGPTILPTLAGEIPAGLRGSLYRNGPALMERGGQHVGHWFDGDGAILAVHFTDARAMGVYRYVQTDGYQQETQAGRFELGGYGMLPAGPWWKRFGKDTKNAANTSVLALPDKLLALWEGGQPHALDLETLETIGLDDLGGLKQRSYSAHPKVDPQTGDIFNFGVSFGKNGVLNLFRSDRTGKLQQQNQLALKGLPLVHDFVMAGRYLIFCIPPVRMEVLPILLQLKSFSDSLKWQTDQGSEILVVDRDTLQEVCRIETDPWYQWHFSNGYELPDGSVVAGIVRYEDFQTNQQLKEVSFGAKQTPAVATYWKLRLNPQSSKVLEMQQVLDRSGEFPVINPQETGQFSRYTYLALHRRKADTTKDMLGAIARFDYQTGILTEADLGPNHYTVEPIYAADADQPEQGWILTVVYDGDTDRSEVWIFAADRLNEQPVCRLALPKIVPLGFHGTWKPAS